MLKNRDIVVVSPQRWGALWVSKHWIASELSKDNRVLFVAPPIWVGGLLRPRTCREIGGRLAWEWRAQVVPNLRVFSPLLIPRRLSNLAGRFFGGEGLQDQVRHELSRLRFQDVILLNFGTRYELVGALGEKVSVYYCVDPPFPRPGEERDERLTCEKSDLIFAISESYRETLSALTGRKDIEVIPHGYPTNRALAIMNEPTAAKPTDLCSIRPPVAGYVGSIHEAYVAPDLLSAVARRHPGVSFVLIGPYAQNPIGPVMSRENLARLRELPNVHFLGPRHHDDLPRYVRHFDVGLILHDLQMPGDPARTKQRTPFKLLHYLSQGKPVVAPPLDELRPIRDLLYLADTPEAYGEAVDAALTESVDRQPSRIAYASRFSYEAVLSAISHHIEAHERGLVPTSVRGWGG